MSEKKVSAMDAYYRAYRDYLDSMKNVSSYNNLKTSLKNSAKNQDGFSGSIAHREIDTEWVEAIEFAVPYIDRAIREQRRFISQNEEIVPIAKSKKVTTESVRHLAQHTNLIGKVEDQKVTPKSILNIQREESFAIYENRFLRSLICRAIEFVGRCYTKIKDTPESALANVQMERESVVDNQLFNVSLNCSLEYNETLTDVDINADVSTLTSYQRVVRLRKILSDFLSAPLIMGLANTPEVRSPVTRTNLLTKDQNFREALKLWEFFDHYEKPGFILVAETNPGPIQPEMQSGMFDVFTLMQFVIKLNISGELKKVLEQNYVNENIRIEKEKQLAEEQREREVKKQIQDALDKQKQEFDIVLAEKEERHQNELDEQNQAWENKYSTTVNEYENQIQEEHIAHDNEISELNNQHNIEIDEINKENAEKIEDTVNHYESVIAEKEDRFEFELASKADKYQKQIEEIQFINETNVEMLSNDFRKEINELTDENNQIRELYEKQIEVIKNDNKMECEAAVATAIAEITRNHSVEIEKYEKRTKDLSIKNKKNEENIEKLKLDSRTMSKKLLESKTKYDLLYSRYTLLNVTYKKKESILKKNNELTKKSYEKKLKKNTQKIERLLMKEVSGLKNSCGNEDAEEGD